jgi:succinyl-CoA synthetase beta subunit
VIHDSSFMILDLAVEVDTVAEFFVDGAWMADDFTYGEQMEKSAEEEAVDELRSKSQAAFSLNVLNQNGGIFMLLSGGGASLVLADEVANLGKGEELANYGEYSGNPNEEETYLYTQQVLHLLLRSRAAKKVLIVGGGVANFTDVRITFRGVIRALDEVKDELRQQGVKIFVRRGGPNQTEGLALIRSFLETEDLYGNVVGPDVELTHIVREGVIQL